MTVRVQRSAIQVLAKAPATAALHRIGAEVAFVDDGDEGVTRVERAAIQVLAKVPAAVTLHRLDAEVAFVDDGDDGVVRVQRAAAQVIAKVPPFVGLHRIGAEAAFVDDGDMGVARVQRAAIQVLARQGVPAPQPLDYPDNLHHFLHNWVDAIEMETAYSTDVSRSPHTGAEERRALVERPMRHLTLSWMRESEEEVERLMALLRRKTDERIPSPLYQDAILVNVDTGASTTRILWADTRYRRFMPGIRIAVFRLGPTYLTPSMVDLYTVSAVFDNRIVTTSNLTQQYLPGQWVIVPLIDGEVSLQPQLTLMTTDTVGVSLGVAEVHGKNSLSPSATGGVIAGLPSSRGLPVFEPNPDWKSGIVTAYLRYGTEEAQGRSVLVEPETQRYVQRQEFALNANRAEFWQVLQLFDSRRGRMGKFWEIDNERLWEVALVQPQFVHVLPLGSFEDFEAQFADDLGIVMNDGTVHTRGVNVIEDLTSTWRITIDGGSLLPSIDVADINRFSRARKKRFEKDALLERWLTTELCQLSFSTIEVLNEGTVTFDGS